MLCKHRQPFQNLEIKISQELGDKEPNKINYFLPDPNQDNDKGVSAEITQQL